MNKFRSAMVAAGTAVALATGAFVAGGSADAATSAATRLIPYGGATMLTLDPATGKALSENHVQVSPVSEARVRHGAIAFPITGGIIRPANMTGFIRHVGGLEFRAGGKELTIRDFRVNLRKMRLIAYADEVRAALPVLRLDLSTARVSAAKSRLHVSGIRTYLTATAAQALNGYFDTKLFKRGLPIGTVDVDALTATLHR
jgi:hypothetical protein